MPYSFVKEKIVIVQRAILLFMFFLLFVPSQRITTKLEHDVNYALFTPFRPTQIIPQKFPFSLSREELHKYTVAVAIFFLLLCGSEMMQRIAEMMVIALRSIFMTALTPRGDVEKPEKDKK